MRHVLTCSEAWEVYATLMLDRRVTTQWRGWSCSSHLSFGLLGEIFIYICVVAASVGCCFGGFYKVILDMCSRVDVNKT